MTLKGETDRHGQTHLPPLEPRPFEHRGDARTQHDESEVATDDDLVVVVVWVAVVVV